MYRIISSHDWHHLRQFYFSNSPEILSYFLLFVFQLFLVGQHLPFATSTDTKVLAKGCCPFF